MVAAEAYCPDVMKQIAAVQGVLNGTTRLVLRKHLETCVADGVAASRTNELIDELMDAFEVRPELEAACGLSRRLTTAAGRSHRLGYDTVTSIVMPPSE